MRHVLTGGPGAGKTTLVEALAATGLPVVPESGRAIIRDQVAAGGDALPWRDAARFAEAMIEADITAYRSAPAGPVLFDRGIPDTIGYLRLIGLPVPRRLTAAARRARYGRIFVAPPWPAIYHTDSERRQDLAEARATHDAIVAAYRELGHRPLRLPRAPSRPGSGTCWPASRTTARSEVDGRRPAVGRAPVPIAPEPARAGAALPWWEPRRRAAPMDSSQYESLIDQQIREATERGEFADLPGSGKPLRNLDATRDELWWLREYIAREGLRSDALLPPALQLRREIELLPETVRGALSEQNVREAVAGLNRRIAEHLRAPSGPALPVAPVDPDAVVARWRADRAARARRPATQGPPDAASRSAEEPGPGRRPWWRRLFRRS